MQANETTLKLSDDEPKSGFLLVKRKKHLKGGESEDTQHGAMISVDRHIGKNMKIGVGYNFTNFDDDLAKTEGDAKGWFINLVGKF